MKIGSRDDGGKFTVSHLKGPKGRGRFQAEQQQSYHAIELETSFRVNDGILLFFLCHVKPKRNYFNLGLREKIKNWD